MWNPNLRQLCPSLLILALVACGGGDPKPASGSKPKPDTSTEAPAADDADASTDSSGGSGSSGGSTSRDRDRGGADDEPVADGPPGRVVGLALFSGDAPERKPLQVSASAGCPHDEPPLTESAIVTDGKLANVFVYVSKGVPSSAVFSAPEEPLVLTQQGCVYAPHVNGAMAGQTIQVSNGDPTSHNVHVVAKRNTEANQNQSAGSAPLELSFDTEEVPVTFVCDIHPWMTAYVCIQENPYWAVSAEDGSFRIDDLPPGKYSLRAWHERYGTQKADVVVQPEGETSVQFTFED